MVCLILFCYRITCLRFCNKRLCNEKGGALLVPEPCICSHNWSMWGEYGFLQMQLVVEIVHQSLRWSHQITVVWPTDRTLGSPVTSLPQPAKVGAWGFGEENKRVGSGPHRERKWSWCSCLRFIWQFDLTVWETLLSFTLYPAETLGTPEAEFWYSARGALSERLLILSPP